MDFTYEISEQELSAELLPAREALGGWGGNVQAVYAENTALALAFDGDAEATAEQDLEVTQEN
ncbi:hypothetical protein [Parasphingorhabdus pacifica]